MPVFGSRYMTKPDSVADEAADSAGKMRLFQSVTDVPFPFCLHFFNTWKER